MNLDTNIYLGIQIQIFYKFTNLDTNLLMNLKIHYKFQKIRYKFQKFRYKNFKKFVINF